MIRPDKHTNLDFSVINISALILQELNAHYIVRYDELLTRLIDKLGEGVRENYPYALDFLYLVGKINYDQKTDSFKYQV